MLHFRSKAEIEDLPVRLFDTGVTTGIGTANKMGNMRGIIGALDIGSSLNIARIKVDLWIHDWTNTGVSGGFPTGVTHAARIRVQKTYERDNFAFLSPVFDWFVFAHSLGDDPVKVYANEALRLADLTLTELQVGQVFQQTNPVVTYWILLRAKTATVDGLWIQLKEPLPRVRAALVTAIGGGISNSTPAGDALFLPSTLVVGTSYSGGRFQSVSDSDFPTFGGQQLATFEYSPGVEYFDYNPTFLPEPTNRFEQLGHTVKLHTGTPEFQPRILIRATNGSIANNYTGENVGIFTEVPPWPQYDQTPRRTFTGPSAGVHNDSWFIRSHSFPSSVYEFPKLEEDNSGTPYTYSPGIVNAGFEAIETQQSFFGSSLPSLTTGRHIDFKAIIKYDMGVLAQEDPTIYPPPDPTRYIRQLNAMK